MHVKLDILAEKGFLELRDYNGPPVPEAEWNQLEYMDWKSGGDTNFAPIASALGEMECAGFWDHGKPDKDGIWTKNASICPTLVQWTKNVEANFGRVRIIKLNPDGEGWVVRAWLELSDDPNSYMVLREDKDDPSTESRISMPRNRQIVIDSQRLWHAAWHPGPEPRYALIVSFESSEDLDRWIKSQMPQTSEVR